MILVVLAALLVGLTAGLLIESRRTQAVLRTELNTARASEQLLLTRLASRTPAEFHAVTALADQPAPVADDTRYLYDETGLIAVEEQGS